MLVAKNISISFNNGTDRTTKALNSVNLTIDDGAFVIVAGSNGSGKSTLLNVIAGTLKPDNGSVELNGKDITHWTEYERARRVARVFQDPFTGTAPQLTVAENIVLAIHRGSPFGLGLALTKAVRNAIRERVSLLRSGLEDRLDSPMGTLSGGQRQALTLLMATWVRPELLLLDEHTAALDPKSAEQILRLTQELITREKLTTLMVTHSMQQAVHMGDRVIMMHRGEIVREFHNTRQRLLRTQDLLNVFEEHRREDQLDETASELIQSRYI